jgi:hypothetical protein
VGFSAATKRILGPLHEGIKSYSQQRLEPAHHKRARFGNGGAEFVLWESTPLHLVGHRIPRRDYSGAFKRQEPLAIGE